MTLPDPRAYPDRPILAVSAVVWRAGQFVVVRRARPPAQGLFTLPGGGVEAGETLKQAVARELREETGLIVEPIDLAGHREVIMRDPEGRVARHFVILAFAAHWREGELSPNEELAEARWIEAAGLVGLPTTEGLAEIVTAARRCLA
jgi:8-oxo-dGTP diphosphatase